MVGFPIMSDFRRKWIVHCLAFEGVYNVRFCRFSLFFAGVIYLVDITPAKRIEKRPK